MFLIPLLASRKTPIVPWNIAMLEESRNEGDLLRDQPRAAVNVGQGALVCPLTQI